MKIKQSLDSAVSQLEHIPLPLLLRKNSPGLEPLFIMYATTAATGHSTDSAH